MLTKAAQRGTRSQERRQRKRGGRTATGNTIVIYDLSSTNDDTSTAAVIEVGPFYIDQTHDCGFKSIDDKISSQEEHLKTPGYLALC